MKKQINIEGMGCANCVRHVTEALKELPGVLDVEVLLNEKNAVVEASAEVSDTSLKEAVEDAGYEVTGIIEL
ncbi:MAG: heavy metal-associated domain-containing protein [Bacillota bacterium]|nr:heavy metal-associated domain-containing protein [Bacillota bacterium]